MNKLKSLIKKNQDFILYTLSFILYTFIQQIVLMPYLSKFSTSTEYSTIIIFLTIFNILCYSIGDELANTKLITLQKYNKIQNKNGDFNYIFVISTILIIIITTIFSTIYKLNLLNICTIILTFVIGIYRHYILAFFKIQNKYFKILLSFVFYFIGIILGILLNNIINSPFIIFMFGELFAFFYYIIVLHKNKIEILQIKKSQIYKNSLAVFLPLFFISLIFNCLNYIDRIIIYPLLGSESMNLYYAATTMSKFSSLIINPLSNIILARLALSSENYIDVIKILLKKYLLLLIIISIVICTSVSYIGVKILYPQYFDNCLNIFIPVGIAMALGIIASILKPVILKYYKTSKFLLLNLIYSLFIILTIYLSHKFDLAGFAYGIMISKIFLLLGYLFCIHRIKGGTKK